MKTLFPIIALLLAGCSKPEEMVVGEWKSTDSSNFTMKLRDDGVMEFTEDDDEMIMGEWKLVLDGEVLETKFQLDGGTFRMFFLMEGPSKLQWFRFTKIHPQYQPDERMTLHDPPIPFYRVVE